MSVINRSGRKTNNPTPKMLPKLLSILPHTPYFLSSQNCFFTYLSPFLPFLASSRSFSPSSHSSPRSLSPITHQWGAAYPHRSAAILLQVPARTQTPKHPMQTKSPLALMEPRFAVTDQLRRQNSSWVHKARESCARSPIVQLHYY
jgi:hypothetical protein